MTTRTKEKPALTLTPTESVSIRRESADLIEVAVTYEPGGDRPLAHLHPDQDETFEVLAGTVRAQVDGAEHTLGPGDTLAIPRGAAHQLWNEGEEPARAIWQTRPAGRTRAWFEALDALQREGRVGSDGMPGLLAFGVLLTEYRDVFRLAARPRSVIRALMAALAPIGRARGYRTANENSG